MGTPPDCCGPNTCSMKSYTCSQPAATTENNQSGLIVVKTSHFPTSFTAALNHVYPFVCRVPMKGLAAFRARTRVHNPFNCSDRSANHNLAIITFLLQRATTLRAHLQCSDAWWAPEISLRINKQDITVHLKTRTRRTRVHEILHAV